MAPTKLYVVPASHPCAVVEKALQLKGISYKRVDLIPGSHVALQKLRFGKRTVPGIVFDDGTKVIGSGAILRELDRRVPEPRIVSETPQVVEAEAWADEVLQPLVRRIVWQSLKRNTKAMASYTEGSNLPIPTSLANLGAGAVAMFEQRLNKAGDDAVRADLANIEDHLDRIDGWLDAGVIGGDAPNAADLQVASGLRLLLTFGDIAPYLEAHRAAELARKWFPDYPGSTPAGVLPREWLPPVSAVPAPVA